MDSLEILDLAFLLQLVSRMVFLVSRLVTFSMSMRSSFLDDILHVSLTHSTARARTRETRVQTERSVAVFSQMCVRSVRVPRSS